MSSCITWYITNYCIPYIGIKLSDKPFDDRPDLNVCEQYSLLTASKYFKGGVPHNMNTKFWLSNPCKKTLAMTMIHTLSTRARYRTEHMHYLN